jgi:hypothetical protein
MLNLHTSPLAAALCDAAFALVLAASFVRNHAFRGA